MIMDIADHFHAVMKPQVPTRIPQSINQTVFNLIILSYLRIRKKFQALPTDQNSNVSQNSFNYQAFQVKTGLPTHFFHLSWQTVKRLA